VFFASSGSAFLKATQRGEQESKEHEFIHLTQKNNCRIDIACCGAIGGRAVFAEADALAAEKGRNCP
jgi:hypothetical protein